MYLQTYTCIKTPFRIPDVDVVAEGQFKHSSDMCMDTLGNKAGGTLGVYRCHNEGGNQVRQFNTCLSLSPMLLFFLFF